MWVNRAGGDVTSRPVAASYHVSSELRVGRDHLSLRHVKWNNCMMSAAGLHGEKGSLWNDAF